MGKDEKKVCKYCGQEGHDESSHAKKSGEEVKESWTDFRQKLIANLNLIDTPQRVIILTSSGHDVGFFLAGEDGQIIELILHCVKGSDHFRDLLRKVILLDNISNI